MWVWENVKLHVCCVTVSECMCVCELWDCECARMCVCVCAHVWVCRYAVWVHACVCWTLVCTPTRSLDLSLAWNTLSCTADTSCWWWGQGLSTNVVPVWVIRVRVVAIILRKGGDVFLYKCHVASEVLLHVGGAWRPLWSLWGDPPSSSWAFKAWSNQPLVMACIFKKATLHTCTDTLPFLT